MLSVRSCVILLVLFGPIAGCGRDANATKQGAIPARPVIPGELSPAEAKAKLRETEKRNLSGRRAGVPPRPKTRR